MTKKQEVKIEEGGYTMVFRRGGKGEIEVDVYKEGKLLHERSYPKLLGVRSLQGQADLWKDQVLLELR